MENEMENLLGKHVIIKIYDLYSPRQGNDSEVEGIIIAQRDPCYYLIAACGDYSQWSKYGNLIGFYRLYSLPIGCAVIDNVDDFSGRYFCWRTKTEILEMWEE